MSELLRNPSARYPLWRNIDAIPVAVFSPFLVISGSPAMRLRAVFVTNSAK